MRHHRRRRILRMLQKRHRGQMGRTRTRNGESGAGHEFGAWRQGIFNQHGYIAVREVGKARRPAASFGQKHRQRHDNRFHRHAHHRKPHANRPDAATGRPHPELPKAIARGKARKVFKDFKDLKDLITPTKNRERTESVPCFGQFRRDRYFTSSNSTSSGCEPPLFCAPPCAPRLRHFHIVRDYCTNPQSIQYLHTLQVCH